MSNLDGKQRGVWIYQLEQGSMHEEVKKNSTPPFPSNQMKLLLADHLDDNLIDW